MDKREYKQRCKKAPFSILYSSHAAQFPFSCSSSSAQNYVIQLGVHWGKITLFTSLTAYNVIYVVITLFHPICFNANEIQCKWGEVSVINCALSADWEQQQQSMPILFTWLISVPDMEGKNEYWQFLFHFPFSSEFPNIPKCKFSIVRELFAIYTDDGYAAERMAMHTQMPTQAHFSNASCSLGTKRPQKWAVCSS